MFFGCEVAKLDSWRGAEVTGDDPQKCKTQRDGVVELRSV